MRIDISLRRYWNHFSDFPLFWKAAFNRIAYTSNHRRLHVDKALPEKTKLFGKIFKPLYWVSGKSVSLHFGLICIFAYLKWCARLCGRMYDSEEWLTSFASTPSYWEGAGLLLKCCRMTASHQNRIGDCPDQSSAYNAKKARNEMKVMYISQRNH